MGKALSMILSTPWVMQESMVETFIKVASRETVIDDFFSDKSVAIAPTEAVDNRFEIRDNIAILSVGGPIFRYANLFERACSMGTSIATISKNFSTAMSDPNIEGILFVFDSPGGEVNGISEMADYIYSARSIKPIFAYVDGLCASGAYWLGTAASALYAADTSIIGSIGVVSVYNKSNSEGEITFVNSKSPYKRLEPESDEGKAQIISRIDALADVFYNKVARNRGVSLDVVEKDFGSGGVFVGTEAVGRNMIDGLSSFEETFAKLKKRCQMAADSSQELAAMQRERDEAVASIAVEQKKHADELASMREELAKVKEEKAAIAKTAMEKELVASVGADHASKLMAFYGKLSDEEVKGLASTIKGEIDARLALAESTGGAKGSDEHADAPNAYQNRVDALVKEGMSPIDAEKQAATEFAQAEQE